MAIAPPQETRHAPVRKRRTLERDRVLEVYREPRPSDGGPAQLQYGSVARLGPGETASPLLAPEARIAVSDLLP